MWLWKTQASKSGNIEELLITFRVSLRLVQFKECRNFELLMGVSVAIRLDKSFLIDNSNYRVSCQNIKIVSQKIHQHQTVI